jgi:hypothetical protein
VSELPNELVLVEWDDAWSSDRLVETDDDYPNQPCSTTVVGFLRSITEERLVVCSDWYPGHDGEPNSLRRCLSIPRAVVRSLHSLTVGQPINSEVDPPNEPSPSMEKP